MSENRSKYIERLLVEIKSLEESVHIIKNSNTMPFSFFRESFEKTQEISNLLHKLEFMQVDDMKNQMEKLVFFLSESEKKGKTQERELERAREIERELTKDLEKEKQKEINLVNNSEKDKQREIELLKELESEKQRDIEQIKKPDEIYKGFVLPEYRNPVSTPPQPAPPVHIVDIKRGVSLNDRFLFQRELFNNNRNDMNSTLERLNSFESYGEAEKYLRDNYNWDFENQTVNDFLLVVKQGYK